MRTWMILACLLASASAQADQAEWISKEMAERAAALIDAGDEVREYCAPCDDEGYTKFVVKKKEVTPVEDEIYYTLRLNDTDMDLAYTYIRSRGGWKNLGMMVEAKVSDVPKVLPRGLKELE